MNQFNTNFDDGPIAINIFLFSSEAGLAEKNSIGDSNGIFIIYLLKTKNERTIVEISWAKKTALDFLFQFSHSYST